MTSDELSKMKAFMERIPGVQVLQADDYENGEVGYHAYFFLSKRTGKIPPNLLDEEVEDVEIWMKSKICNKTQWIDGTDENGILPFELIESTIRKTIRTRGWCTIDNPRERLMGFAKPAHASIPSMAFMVRLDDIKRLPSLLRTELNGWRMRNNNFERAATIAKGYLWVTEGTHL